MYIVHTYIHVCLQFQPSMWLDYPITVDLWVIKIKTPMILCAHSTSRLGEQSVEHRSCSKNMLNVCLFYGQNNKIVWLSNIADEEFTRCAKVCGLFFFIMLFRCWLAGQANFDHMVQVVWDHAGAARIIYFSNTCFPRLLNRDVRTFWHWPSKPEWRFSRVTWGHYWRINQIMLLHWAIWCLFIKSPLATGVKFQTLDSLNWLTW